jgi:hypothetical protein
VYIALHCAAHLELLPLQLLRPPKSVERGVYEAHYIQLRPKEEVRALVVDEAGIRMSEEQFEEVRGWGEWVEAG